MSDGMKDLVGEPLGTERIRGPKAAPPPAASRLAKELIELELEEQRANEEALKAEEALRRVREALPKKRAALIEAVEREKGWGKVYVVSIDCTRSMTGKVVKAVRVEVVDDGDPSCSRAPQRKVVVMDVEEGR